MTRRTRTIGPAWFETLYATDPDPWRFASSDYERGKYAASLAALPDRRFANALEIGCSIGIFTRHLSPRCDRLLALDVAEGALEQARENCEAANVKFVNAGVPQQWPPGTFDLIVLSEVLYYLDPGDIGTVAGLARDALSDDGIALLVHYLGGTDYPVSGDAAAETFIAESGLPVLAAHRTDRYRIDVLGR